MAAHDGPLAGQVAVVAGATRGAGRGIAHMLGAAGAAVYCSGRSSRAHPGPPGRPETIEDTAALVDAAGGHGIAVRTDHTDEAAVQALFARVAAEHGRLDVLVNDIWGGDELTRWTPFWTQDVAPGFALLDTAVRTHVITARHALPLMLQAQRGLLVEVTDGDHAGYRGSFYYDLAKNAVIRIAFALAQELAPHGVTALAVTPGFLRSEAMLDHMGVTHDTWREAIPKARGFEASETPCYIGRAIAALAADADVARKAGGVYATWTLAREYGFTDLDGSQPQWDRYVERSCTEILDRGGPANAEERGWLDAWAMQWQGDPRHAALLARIAAARG